MLDAERWELYHAAEDFAENYDVAAENRGKVIELIAQWYVEAGRYNVLPIDGSVVTRLMTERPQLTEARTSYTFWPGTEMVPAAVGPRVLNRPHSITADVDHPGGRRRGRVAVSGSQQRRFRLLREGPAAALRPQLPQPGDPPRVLRRIRCPRAVTGCGSSSSPPANRTSPTAEGRRAGPSSTSTINSWPRPTSR